MGKNLLADICIYVKCLLCSYLRSVLLRRVSMCTCFHVSNKSLHCAYLFADVRLTEVSYHF